MDMLSVNAVKYLHSLVLVNLFMQYTPMGHQNTKYSPAKNLILTLKDEKIHIQPASHTSMKPCKL